MRSLSTVIDTGKQFSFWFAVTNINCFRAFKEERRKEIAISRDIVGTGVHYTRMANMGLGILRLKDQHLTASHKAAIQQEVAGSGHCAFKRFLEGGAYRNLEQILSTWDEISWLSERDRGVKDLYKMFLELHRGNSVGVERKAKEWLRLSKERCWGAEKTLASRVLAALNAM